MTKRSRKRPGRSQEDSGCMGGLISMFDFRHGRSTQKLLSDKKRGSARHAGIEYLRSKYDLLSNFEEKREGVDVTLTDISDFDERKVRKVNLGMASIKTLMEEEMSGELTPKKSRTAEVEWTKPNLGLAVNHENNHKQESKSYKEASNLHANDLRGVESLESHHFNCLNPSETSAFDLNLASLVEMFCSDNHQCRETNLDCKPQIDSCPSKKSIDPTKPNYFEKPDSQLVHMHSVLQKALAEVFLNQKFIDTEHLTCHGAVHQPKEVMDALEVLNSNKELVLNLLQDPNSLLMKHIQDLQKAQADKLSKLESYKYLKVSQLLGEEADSSGQHEESVSYKQFQKQSGHNFFRKKDKSKGSIPSKGSDDSQALNRIVVLKPSPAIIQNPSIMSPRSSPESHYSLQCQEDSERVSSHFSLKEIKRRLRHAIGESKKERHLISMDGILHRIPYGFQDSGDIGKQITRVNVETGLACKTSSNNECTSQPSAVIKRRKKKSKSKECQPDIDNEPASPKVDKHKKLNMTAVAHSLHRELYEEGKNHLAEILNTGDENEILPTKQVPKPLGRILSLPGYSLLSPRLSPGRDEPQQMTLSPLRQFNQEKATNQLSPLREELENSPSTDSYTNCEVKVIDLKTSCHDTPIQEGICIGEYLNPIGSMEIVVDGTNDESNHLDVPSKSNGNKPNLIDERCMEEGSSMLSGMPFEEEPQQATPPISISTSSLPEQNIEATGSIMVKLERPSPVSVLEPFSPEDIIIPGSRPFELAELSIQPRQIHFKEHDKSAVALTTSDPENNLKICMNDKEARFDYVKTVLEASGLNCNDISEIWHLSDHLLDRSFFDEVEISSCHLPNDPKLLFDCINEVLVEIQEKYFCCTPWLSFVNPNIQPIPMGSNFIQEVCKGIEWHLLRRFPHTLDQVVRKDMEGGAWMDIWFETESVGIEMEDVILEDLIDETILEL